MVKSNKNIPYEVCGALKNPFKFRNKKKDQ